MLRDIGVDLPVQRWKCHVLTADAELVPRITVWLYAAGVTLVPYDGRTLIADKRRYLAADGNDRTPVPEAMEGLIADLADCFPALHRQPLALRLHTCIKTEVSLGETSSRNQDLAVFDTTFHGVHGLTVMFPGKASLMFALARAVATQVFDTVMATPATQLALAG